MNAVKLRPQLADFRKGDVLSEGVLARMTGKKPGTDAYKLAVLFVRQELEHKHKLLSRCEGNALHILDDPGALEYQERAQRFVFRKIETHKRRFDLINTSKLNTQERDRLDHASRLSTAIAIAAKRVRRRFKRQK